MQTQTRPSADMNLLRRLSQRCRQWAACFIVTLAAASPAVAGLDNWSTGPGAGGPDSLCDVWQAIYNGWGLVPGNDEDKDGCSNLVESIAGTNPRLAGDCLKVGNLVISASNVVFTFDAEAGKRYRVLSDNSPGGSFATIVTLTAVNGVSQNITAYDPDVNAAGQSVSIAKDPASRKFYKLQVSDRDTDGDGVSNWAEIRLGLNPNSNQTTPGVFDNTFVSSQLALPHEVTIIASAPIASEDGPQSGAFKISRAQTLLPITVQVSDSGTATPGNDYKVSLGGNETNVIPSSVNLPAGTSELTLFINPQQNLPSTEGSESVTATLVAPPPSASFTLGANKTATVIINDSTAPAGTGLLAQYYDHGNSNYDHAANFGDAATYAYTRAGVTPDFTGTAIVRPTGMSPQRLSDILTAITVGSTQVKLSFIGGNLNTAVYNHFSYLVTAKTAISFTIALPPGAGLPTSSTSTCQFNLQTLHPGVIERVEPVVDINWLYGTPNGVVVAPMNSPDNYSSVWEAYLAPTTAGSYVFRLDADDKARVLLDTDADGPGELVEVLEHGWDGPVTPEVIGTFKQSAAYTLAIPTTPAKRYKIRVEQVETTGDATCRLQWSVNGAAFVNIPQANQFTHTQVLTYRHIAGNVDITPTGGYALSVGDWVDLAFSTGALFTPGVSSTNNGSYQITAVVGTGVPVTIPNAVTVAGNATISVPSTAGLALGMLVTGTGLPANEYITAIGAGTITVTTGTSVTAQASTTLTASSNFTVAIPATTVTVVGAVTTNASATVTVPTTAGLIVGMSVTGTGIPAGKFITAIGTTTITITNGTGVTAQTSTDLTCSLGGPSITVAGAATTAGSATVIVPSINGLAVGMSITGLGLPTNATISAVGPGMILLSTATGVTTQASTTLTAFLHPTNTVTGVGFFLNNSTSTTTGLYNQIYANTGFANSPGRIGVDNAVTTVNNGTWGTGTPDVNLINPDTFSIRWTGQIQPQFTEEYTFSVLADDGFRLWINGQELSLSQLASTNLGSSTYTYISSSGETTVDYSASNFEPGSVGLGDVVRLDPTAGSLGTPFATTDLIVTEVVSPTVFKVTFPASYGDQTTGAAISMDALNRKIKPWVSNANERFVRIPLVGGVRYDIKLEYWENTSAARAHLYWTSSSQPKQVIPASRLYPTSVPSAPPAHVSATDAAALVGGPFSYTILGSNLGNISISGAPAWLNYNSLTGELSGTPTAAGSHQIVITLTGPAGTSTSVLNLNVANTGGTIARQLWSGVAGTTVASIPTSANPTSTSNLSSLQGPTGAGPNYGARIRGYITAPETGNYYFWIAANNAAELWISNDAEPVNTFKRAWVTTGSATPLTYGGEANQKSPWLALEQGKRYYIEILHKAGTGTGDNLAVGWLKPGQSGTVPSELVPGYVLSPYVPPLPGSTPGTLYIATMLSQSGAVTNGVGNSTLRLSEDENTAYMKRSYSGLTGPITSEHIHTDPYLDKPSTIVFDIDAPVTPGDGLITNLTDPNYGAYKWTILPVGTLSKAQIIEILREGKAYINLHTAAYPNGEIRGNFTLANGTRTFTPPPAPPAFADDSGTDTGAARFLMQASFGANLADIAALKAIVPTGGKTRYEMWIDDQINNKGQTPLLPEVLAREIADVFGPFDVKIAFATWWKTSMTAPDQLRQRLAFALSEIHVVSADGPLEDRSQTLAHFYDTLATNAFGNFRDMLRSTTLTPGMGRYLDMLRNDKPDLTVGRIPNENYAREIKQLFSIGLYRMWPDGTLMLNSKESPIDTYSQREIVGLSHVFTGWEYGYDGALRTSFNAAVDWTRPMREVPARHFTGTKRILNNEVLPGLGKVGSQPLDPFATHNSMVFNDPAYQALPSLELNLSNDQLFNHPNTGPFICRQLIQRLVTSHPSRDYLYRVVQKFNDNGSGVSGDMKAVIKAILLDYEARSSDMITKPAFGKQREPIMRVANAARAFRPNNVTGNYTQNGSNLITVTTSTPHLLTATNNVFLEFTDATSLGAQPAPTTGVYAVSTVVSPTQYTIPAPGWVTGTYDQTGGSNVMTVNIGSHWVPGVNASQPSLPAVNWGQAYFDFTSGTANGLSGFDLTVRTAQTSTSFDTPSGASNVAGTTFTITAPDTTARSGNVMISRFTSSFQSSGNGGVITIDTTYGGTGAVGGQADHGLSVGDTVFINFNKTRDTTSGNPTSTENDIVYTITEVTDPNTFKVAARNAANAAMGSDNSIYVFPLKAQPLVRNGTINTRPSSFVMGNTDSDLQQTPLNSPTVFNYFLPDFKYAGTLASQGITTPEFQLTSETTVIRQANYLYNGLFNPSSTTGISSFATGSNALVMDFSPWMSTTAAPNLGLGAAPQPTQAWTSNANVGTLIDQLNTLLMAGQLPASVKAVILNLLAQPAISAIPVSNPCSVTTASPHGLVTGDSITIAGVTGGTFRNAANTADAPINATFSVTVTSTTAFTLLGGIRCTSVAGLNLANANFSLIPYTNASPNATQVRDRLRNIIHLILTSPDYTIQR